MNPCHYSMTHTLQTNYQWKANKCLAFLGSFMRGVSENGVVFEKLWKASFEENSLEAKVTLYVKVFSLFILLFTLCRYAEAQGIANDLLRMDSNNADAMFVRGLCLYYEDHVDKAFTHFQQVLRLAPDHSQARETYKVIHHQCQWLPSMSLSCL